MRKDDGVRRVDATEQGGVDDPLDMTPVRMHSSITPQIWKEERRVRHGDEDEDSCCRRGQERTRRRLADTSSSERYDSSLLYTLGQTTREHVSSRASSRIGTWPRHSQLSDRQLSGRSKVEVGSVACPSSRIMPLLLAQTHVMLPRQRLETLRVVEQERRLLGHLSLGRLRLLLCLPILLRARRLLLTDLLKLRRGGDLTRGRSHPVGLVSTGGGGVRLVDRPEVQVLVNLRALVDDAGKIDEGGIGSDKQARRSWPASNLGAGRLTSLLRPSSTRSQQAGHLRRRRRVSALISARCLVEAHH